METRKYRKVMLSVWGIINISIIICFIFEFFNTERYLMAEMYLKYFLLPLYLSFPLGTAAVFITIIMLNFLFPNLSNFTGTNLILLLICYSVATVAFYFQWIYLLPKFFFKKNKQQRTRIGLLGSASLMVSLINQLAGFAYRNDVLS